MPSVGLAAPLPSTVTGALKRSSALTVSPTSQVPFAPGPEVTDADVTRISEAVGAGPGTSASTAAARVRLSSVQSASAAAQSSAGASASVTAESDEGVTARSQARRLAESTCRASVTLAPVAAMAPSSACASTAGSSLNVRRTVNAVSPSWAAGSDAK